DGATWLRASGLGLEEDRVIVKSSGEPTYRLPDIAYHTTKFDRGFDLMVDLFGADHIATYPDVLAGIGALGYDQSKVRVLIHQFVTLTEGGEKVKMSTRKANFVTLDELMDLVGEEVTRYFFLMRGMNSHLNFDLTLASTQSDENPVYYIQYAHARIVNIERFASNQGISLGSRVTLELLGEEVELDLIRKMIEFPVAILRMHDTLEPQVLTQYLTELATLFHKFYFEYRVVTEEAELSQARLALVAAAKTIFGSGLKILGISAPERM
ncbi:MAG: DALR anticodon-binding domain-containing protein, partial [bacterium]